MWGHASAGFGVVPAPNRSAGGYWVVAFAATTTAGMSQQCIPAEGASRPRAGIK
jgi:hypothetical protein